MVALCLSPSLPLPLAMLFSHAVYTHTHTHTRTHPPDRLQRAGALSTDCRSCLCCVCWLRWRRLEPPHHMHNLSACVHHANKTGAVNSTCGVFGNTQHICTNGLGKNTFGRSAEQCKEWCSREGTRMHHFTCPPIPIRTATLCACTHEQRLHQPMSCS